MLSIIGGQTMTNGLRCLSLMMQEILKISSVCVAVAVGLLSVLNADAKAGSLKDGFIATCVDVFGYSYAKGSWHKDGFSGHTFKIVYDGGETFRVDGDLFEYRVIFETNVAIAGVGIYNNNIYTFKISTITNEMTYTHQADLSDYTRTSAFVGKCKIRS